jgi:hypothetical protein
LAEPFCHIQRAALAMLQAVIKPTIPNTSAGNRSWSDPLRSGKRLNIGYQLFSNHVAI